ncbi:MAG: hypothetical protein HY293_07535 [Planctomycetes bacterium]|nr:hypothetical protein [Planctomycetota bacterium]
MNSGKKWVLGLLALGAAAGLVAVTYWKRPENSVRWSFTQIHTSLVRGKKEAAARFLAPRVTWNGKEMSSAEFLAAYTLPSEADEIETAVCPVAASHLTVTMKGLVYCFVSDGSTLWRLHALTDKNCACKP